MCRGSDGTAVGGIRLPGQEDIKAVPGDTGQSRHDFNSAGGYLHVVFGHIADTFISYCQHVFWISDARKLCTFLGGYILVIFSMFSLGMMVGGIAPDTKSAGVIASLLYFPMLIFSGATLPYEIMPPAFQTVANVLPLTQGIKILKAACLGLPPENAAVPALIMAALAVICVTVLFLFFKWE